MINSQKGRSLKFKIIDQYIKERALCHIQASIFLFLLLFISLFFNFLYFNNYTLLCVTVFIICTLSFIFSTKYDGYFSISSFFLLTCSIFIFGRHAAYVLSFGNVDIKGGSFFTDIHVDDLTLFKNTYILLFSVVLFYASCSFVKFIVFFNCPKKKYVYLNGFNNNKNNSFFLNVIFVIIVFFVTYNLFFLLNYVKNYGYVGIYLANIAMDKSPTLMWKMQNYISLLLYVVFAYSFILFKSVKYSLLFLSVIIFKSIIMLSLGQRGPFFCLVLFLISIFSIYKNVSMFKLVLFGLSLIFLSQMINSLRLGDGLDVFYLPYLVGKFLYQQGVSFYVFNISTYLDYPIRSGFYTLVPGYSMYSQAVLGQSFELYNISPAHILSYSLNKDLYFQGAGLGWSVFSDFYILTGNVYFVPVMSSFLGGFVGVCESKYSNKYIKFVFYSITIPFLFLPRASIYSIMPILLISLSFLILVFLSKKYKVTT